MRVGLGDLRPDVHRGLRVLHHPAGLAQPLHQDVAALLVLPGDIADALLVAFQSGNGRHLQGREGAVVVVALDPRQAETSSGLPTMKPIRQPAML